MGVPLRARRPGARGHGAGEGSAWQLSSPARSVRCDTGGARSHHGRRTAPTVRPGHPARGCGLPSAAGCWERAAAGPDWGNPPASRLGRVGRVGFVFAGIGTAAGVCSWRAGLPWHSTSGDPPHARLLSRPSGAVSGHVPFRVDLAFAKVVPGRNRFGSARPPAGDEPGRPAWEPGHTFCGTDSPRSPRSRAAAPIRCRGRRAQVQRPRAERRARTTLPLDSPDDSGPPGFYSW